MKSVDLSIIITAHGEGLLAHKTMLSVERAAKVLRTHKVNYEIIVHIDNGTPETKAYFARHKNDKKVVIYENKFGDPGSSRNFAVEQARGEYVTLLDADDLVSENWFWAGYRQVREAAEPIVVHPEANLTFGGGLERQTLWVQSDSIDEATDAMLMVSVNRWAMPMLAPKGVFLSFPFFKIGKGYGNEDYYFNTETLAAGIRHEVTPGAVAFYRKKREGSVFAANVDRVQPYSKLLEIERFREVAAKWDDQPAEQRSAYDRARGVYRKLRQNPKLDRLLTPIAYRTVNRIKARQNYDVPDFVIDEWRQMNQIESELYPTEERLRSLVFYNSEEHAYVGTQYLELVRGVEKLPDYVFIVPWVVAGGADKVLLSYLRAFGELHPKWKIAVITTEQAENTWAGKLPENAYLIDYGNAVRDLAYKVDRDALFARLITQLKCKKLHIINSEYGYNWVAEHKELVKHNYEVNVSLFCHDVIAGTEGVFDYADPYLLEIYPLVKKIYTDNAAVIDRVVELDGFDREKFVVQYQPEDMEVREPELGGKGADGKVHILWASRVAAQKNPELLKKIGRGLDPGKFQIDVYGRLDGRYRKDYFADVPAIRYHGAYDGIGSLDPEAFAMFLYTSLIDGLPNILLEVTALGLPIIASDAGGAKEFIKDGKTGRLMAVDAGAGEYVAAIKEAAREPEKYLAYARAAQKLLKKQHSFEAYLKKVSEDF